MSQPVKTHPNTLSSSRTLVVGGTSGVGAAVASGALANGGSVHVSSSNPKKIAAKIDESKALYPGAAISGTAADLLDENKLEENVQRVLEEAVKALGGPIDHLVYTAGELFELKPISEVDPKSYFKAWNVRYLAPLTFAKAISGNPGTYLKVDATSSITFTSGILSHKPIPGVAHIVGWAGAIEAMARGLALDLAPVRVNVVSLGAIGTEELLGFGEAALSRFADGTLVKKLGKPNEAAEAYLFSMRSASMDGEVIKIDGGASLV